MSGGPKNRAPLLHIMSFIKRENDEPRSQVFSGFFGSRSEAPRSPMQCLFSINTQFCHFSSVSLPLALNAEWLQGNGGQQHD